MRDILIHEYFGVDLKMTWVVLASGIITIISTLWLYILTIGHKKITPLHLTVNGLSYLAFVIIVVSMH